MITTMKVKKYICILSKIFTPSQKTLSFGEIESFSGCAYIPRWPKWRAKQIHCQKRTTYRKKKIDGQKQGRQRQKEKKMKEKRNRQKIVALNLRGIDTSL